MKDLDLRWLPRPSGEAIRLPESDARAHWTRLHFRVEAILCSDRAGSINHAWQAVSAAVRDLLDAQDRDLTPDRARWLRRRHDELADLLTQMDKEITTVVDAETGAQSAAANEEGDPRWLAAQQCRQFFDLELSRRVPEAGPYLKV